MYKKTSSSEGSLDDALPDAGLDRRDFLRTGIRYSLGAAAASVLIPACSGSGVGKKLRDIGAELDDLYTRMGLFLEKKRSGLGSAVTDARQAFHEYRLSKRLEHGCVSAPVEVVAMNGRHDSTLDVLLRHSEHDGVYIDVRPLTRHRWVNLRKGDTGILSFNYFGKRSPAEDSWRRLYCHGEEGLCSGIVVTGSQESIKVRVSQAERAHYRSLSSFGSFRWSDIQGIALRKLYAPERCRVRRLRDFAESITRGVWLYRAEVGDTASGIAHRFNSEDRQSVGTRLTATEKDVFNVIRSPDGSGRRILDEAGYFIREGRDYAVWPLGPSISPD